MMADELSVCNFLSVCNLYLKRVTGSSSLYQLMEGILLPDLCVCRTSLETQRRLEKQRRLEN
jgi:hypothetical protein